MIRRARRDAVAPRHHRYRRPWGGIDLYRLRDNLPHQSVYAVSWRAPGSRCWMHVGYVVRDQRAGRRARPRRWVGLDLLMEAVGQAESLSLAAVGLAARHLEMERWAARVVSEAAAADDCDEDDVAPCWCGETNPEYSEDLDKSCGGDGTLRCHCGGDLCICHNHGEVDCPGCMDCDGGDDDGDQDDEDDE